MRQSSILRRAAGRRRAALAVIALLAALAPAAAPAPAAAGRVWWGSYVDGGQYGYDNPPWDMRALVRFERNAGRRAAILHFGLQWYDGATPQEFPVRAMRNLTRRGVVPLIDWSSWDRRGSGGPNQPRFALRRIIAGDFDAAIRRFAIDSRRFGRPFFLRFNHEMNGHWFPWSERVNGNRPGEFRAAWRHVHAIFRAVGARNVTWVWSPNVVYRGSIPLRRLYPGDDVVDWVALDGYNWGEHPAKDERWRSFAAIFAPSYRQLRRLAPTKPMMIAEVASTEHGGSKARWTRDALRVLPRRFPAVRALLWFNWEAEGYDWPIESSPAATAAFRAGIASSAYAGPPGRLPSRAIRPPR